MPTDLDRSNIVSGRIKQTELNAGIIPASNDKSPFINLCGNATFENYAEFEMSRNDAIKIIQEVYGLFRKELKLNQERRDIHRRWREIFA